MVFEHIEKLKGDYTDQYVVVDASRPELARFKGTTGRVKTVNMNGMALVEFDQYSNIGWYDIDVDYLKVVPKPAPKEPEKKAKAAPRAAAAKATKPAAGEKKLSPLELARMQGAAKGKEKEPAAKTKPSTADILAAARGKKAAAAKGQEEAAAEAKPSSSPAPEKKLSEMTVQEKLAYMRGAKPGPAAASPSPQASAEQKKPEPEADQEPPEASAAEPGPPAEELASEAAEPQPSGEKVDKSSMSAADMVAWCRQHDSQ